MIRVATIVLLLGNASFAATVSVGHVTAGPEHGGAALPLHLDPYLSEEVSAVLVDIAFDSNSLTLSEAIPGPAAAAAGKSVNVVEFSPGVVRVIVAGLNQEAMYEGVVAEVSLLFSPGIPPGFHPVSLGYTELSDPYGSRLEVSTVSGGVYIEGPEEEGEGEGKTDEAFEEEEPAPSVDETDDGLQEDASDVQAEDDASALDTEAATDSGTSTSSSGTTSATGRSGGSYGYGAGRDVDGESSSARGDRPRGSHGSPGYAGGSSAGSPIRGYGGSRTIGNPGGGGAYSSRGAPSSRSIPSRSVRSSSGVSSHAPRSGITPSFGGAVSLQEPAYAAADGRERLAMAVPGTVDPRLRTGMESDGALDSGLLAAPRGWRGIGHGLAGLAVGLFVALLLFVVRGLAFRGKRHVRRPLSE